MCKGISVSKSRIPLELIEEFDLTRRVSSRVFDDPDQLHFMYTDPVVELPVIHQGRIALCEWGNCGPDADFVGAGNVMFRLVLYLWAAPATVLGLLPLPLVLMQGGNVRIVRGVVEAHGGIVTWLLRRGLPWVGSGAAITFGHVVWGCDQSCLDWSRDHERVHVRQYERWGPLFIPLYLLAAAVAAWKGLDPYRDNPFEREAFELTDR